MGSLWTKAEVISVEKSHFSEVSQAEPMEDLHAEEDIVALWFN